jgi:hypothetical protein
MRLSVAFDELPEDPCSDLTYILIWLSFLARARGVFFRVLGVPLDFRFGIHSILPHLEAERHV